MSDKKYFKRNEVLARQVSRVTCRHIDGHGTTLEKRTYNIQGIARPGVPVYWNGGQAGALILAPRRGGGGSLPLQIERPAGLYPAGLTVDQVVELELAK